MSPLVLLGLMSLGFLFVTLDDNEDTDLTENADVQEDDVEVTGEEDTTGTATETSETEDDASASDDTTTTGTAGTSDEVGIEVGSDEIRNLTDANEVVTLVDGASDTSIRAAGGNDVLNVFGTESFVDAEEGNDTINATDAAGTGLRGGEGNDVFNLSGVGYSDDNNDSLEAHGEDGDDLFTVAEGSTDINVQGNDGNDTITGSSANGVFHGFAGDDVISFTGEGLRASGGEGDDTITSTDGATGNVSRIEGGMGDDLITLARNDGGFAHTGLSADGDMGNDTIITQTALDIEGQDDVTDTLGGGDGEDTFDLSFFLHDGHTPDNDSNADVVLQIEDFNPGEDTLIVRGEITDGAGEGTGYTLSVEDIVIDELTETRSTDVTMTYMAADGETQMTVTVRLDDVRDFEFGLDDITIV